MKQKSSVPFIVLGLAFNLAQAAPPQGMAWIPAGEFTMGTDDPNSFPNERPAHRVKVDGFWMDARDVTNDEFRKFVKATGYVTTAEHPPDWNELKKELPPGTPKPDGSLLVPGSLVFTGTTGPVDLDDVSQWWRWTPGASWQHPGGPDTNIKGTGNYPVVQISWDDAVAYTKWAGKRLPTEAEWEYATRGGATNNTRYWWGDEFRPNGKYMANTWTGEFPCSNNKADGYEGLAPVGSFPANGYGLYDMAGNVWQWCSDWYRADTPAQMKAVPGGCCFNPAGPAKSFDPLEPYAAERVIKGGSFLCNASYCESYRPTARRGEAPDTSMSHIGFRCVRSADARTQSGADKTETKHH